MALKAKELNKNLKQMKKLLKIIKKPKNLKGVCVSLVAVSCLTACSLLPTRTVYVDNFKNDWGKPICLNDPTKEVVSYNNAFYFVTHNEKLGLKKDYCDKQRK